MKNLAYAVRPMALDMLATLLFAGVFALTKSLNLSTAIGIGVGLSQLAWLALSRRRIAALQFASVGLVIVMGGAAILTRDPRFVMVKPTIVYAVVALSMLQPGWLVRYLPPASVDRLPRGAVVWAGFGWAALMALTAGLNLYFAFATSAAAWAAFLATFPLASKLAAFAITYAGLRRAARASVVEPVAA